MRKEITICGASLTAEGVDKADLQADEDSAKWYAEKTGFDLNKLMQQAGWVTAHRHLIEDINKAVGGSVFPALVPSKDYAKKEAAAMDSGIGVKRLKTAAERIKEIFTLDAEKIAKIKDTVTSGKSEEEISEVLKDCGLDASSLPRGFFKMDPKEFDKLTKAFDKFGADIYESPDGDEDDDDEIEDDGSWDDDTDEDEEDDFSF